MSYMNEKGRMYYSGSHTAANSTRPYSHRVAVVILDYSRVEDTIECVNSILMCEPDNKRVIVLDNGSASDDASVLDSTFGSRVDILKVTRNMGVASGWNHAIEHAFTRYSPEHVLLLNNDVVLDSTVVTELLDFMDSEGRAGAVGPTVLTHDRPHRHQYRRLREVKKPRIDFKLSGCALLIRGCVLKQMGGFDEDFFAYSEERDFLERMRKSEWLPYYVPTCGRAYHKGARTSSSISGFEAFHRSRSALLFISKNAGWRRMIPWLVSYMLYVQSRGIISDSQSGNVGLALVSRARGIMTGILGFSRYSKRNIKKF